MSRKLPRIEHVKHVRAKGKVYPSFDTGRRKANGQPILSPLPPLGSVGFWDAYAALKAVRTKRAASVFTVAQLIEAFLSSADLLGKADATQRLYRVQLGKVQSILGDFPVEDLHASDIRTAIEAERFTPATRNAFVSAIAALYKWAREQDKTELRPTANIGRLKMGEHDPWPDDVLTAALAADDDLVRLGVHLLYYTGQRIGDVCKLRWNDVRDGVVHLRQQKTSKVLAVPLHASLRAELARTTKRGLTILADANGRPILVQRLRLALKAFTRGIGAETVPHGLRKNAVNSLLLSECTVAEVAAITGQTHQMVEHYAKKIDRLRLGQAAMLKFERGTSAEQENARENRAENGGNPRVSGQYD